MCPSAPPAPARRRHAPAPLLAPLLLFCLNPPAARAAAAGEPVRLRPDTPVERRLAAGEVHAYEAEVAAGERWLATVEQRGIDVVVEASEPAFGSLTVDAPTYRIGSESLLLPAAAAGTVRLAVRSADPAVGPGRYEILIRQAEPRELAAEAAMTDAARLNFEATAEARRQAIDRYREALALWQAAGDRRQEARTLLCLGVLHRRAGEPRRAIEFYRLARPLFQALGDRAADAIAASDLGLAHWRLGENDLAQPLLEEALALQRQLGNRYGEAIARNNLCLRAQSRGELKAARRCYRVVLDLLRDQGELRYEALVLRNLGSVHHNLGEPGEALRYHRRALELHRSAGDRPGEARALNNLAVVHRAIGEMQQALGDYGSALDILRQGEDRRQLAVTLHNVGFTYYSLGEPERALAYLQQALDLRREVGDRRGESITLNVLGRVRASLGETAAALELHRQALELRRAVGDRRGEAITLNLLARGLLASGDPAAALELLDRASELAGAAGDRRETATALHLRGEARLRLGEPEEALASLDRALAERRAVQDRPGEAETLSARARAERRLGRPAAARREVEAALEVIESLRTRVSAPDLRASYLATQRRAYELSIDLLMELDAADPAAGFAARAVEVSERARARGLLDLLSAAGADLRRGLDPELKERQNELLRRLNAKATRRLELLSRGRPEQEAELDLTSVVAELDLVEAEIRRRSPGYEALAHPRPLALPQIQSLLDDGTLLLEYALGEERSFLWAITAGDCDGFELAPRSEIESAARRLAAGLATVDREAAAAEREAAATLSRLLLGPVAQLLASQRLVVVADGALHYLPFAVLPRPAAGEAAGRDEPLIVRHEVVHLPSASTLALQRSSVAGRPAAPRWAAVVADPVFDPRDPRIAASREPATAQRAIRDPGLGFDRLPSTRREAAAIAAVAPPGEVLLALDFDASRALVLGGELRPYRIVHFATHGLIDDARPELSGLALSLVDERGEAREGFVRLRDVYNLELGADLVVLSGCRTALGREVRGEGLVGLTRGFMHAGATRVVASLWRVADRATAELMARFYRAMRDGPRPAAALREAQLAVREQRSFRDPYYWGAFVLQGDWR